MTMKNTDRTGNGNDQMNPGEFTTQVIDENPYLQRLPDLAQRDQSLPENEAFGEVIGDEDGAPIEPEDERRKVKQRRRRLALVGVAILFLMAIIFAVAI